MKPKVTLETPSDSRVENPFSKSIQLIPEISLNKINLLYEELDDNENWEIRFRITLLNGWITLIPNKFDAGIFACRCRSSALGPDSAPISEAFS
ncbi:hypothetical protein CDAR_218751 [Caerostris darwini]|uniref:Uncharacterized protein n=1 Tax=Caerostris darwini TaxID=1538125 RepID=A0AAV4UGN1_9ARAC|nr:hypothetical protein CDAR_218751 [Caerostris darwini]